MGWNVIGWIKDRFAAAPARRAPLPAETPVIEEPVVCDAVSLGAVGQAAASACRAPKDRDQILLAFQGVPSGALGPAVASAYQKAYKSGMSYQGYAAAVQAGLGHTPGLLAAAGVAALAGAGGSDKDRCTLAHAFVGQLARKKPPLESVAAAFAGASDAGMSWATYTAAMDGAFLSLESQTHFARLGRSALKAAGSDGGKVGRQAMRQLSQQGTQGQRAAAFMIASAKEGMDWANFRSASLAVFRELEAMPGAPQDERDLANVARTCLEACRDGQDGGKVAWSFLEELKSGQADPAARRLARILLSASDRGMSWGGYASALRAGLDVLEADGSEAVLIEAGRRGMDACRSDVDRGKVGRAVMRQLKSPLTERPEVALGRMVLAASDEGMSWESFSPVSSRALEALGETDLSAERRLFVQVALAAQRAGQSSEEKGKLGRAFLGELSTWKDDEAGPALSRAYQRAAGDGLSWGGYESSIEVGVTALQSSGLMGEAGRLALDTRPSGEVRARCSARLDALQRLGRLGGVREEVEKLVSNPVSTGVEVDEQKVLVGGVRLKVRREDPQEPSSPPVVLSTNLS